MKDRIREWVRDRQIARTGQPRYIVVTLPTSSMPLLERALLWWTRPRPAGLRFTKMV